MKENKNLSINDFLFKFLLNFRKCVNKYKIKHLMTASIVEKVFQIHWSQIDPALLSVEKGEKVWIQRIIKKIILEFPLHTIVTTHSLFRQYFLFLFSQNNYWQVKYRWSEETFNLWLFRKAKIDSKQKQPPTVFCKNRISWKCCAGFWIRLC